VLVAICARRTALMQTAGGELEGERNSPEMSRIMAQQPAIDLFICLGAWNLGGGR
jgi:hypothetical protein